MPVNIEKYRAVVEAIYWIRTQDWYEAKHEDYYCKLAWDNPASAGLLAQQYTLQLAAAPTMPSWRNLWGLI